MSSLLFHAVGNHLCEWRHTHVTVVHVTKACRSGLSERSHVFTQISTWVTCACADLRGRGGGYWTIRLISQFIYMLRTVYLSGKEHYYYSCQKIPAILKKMKIRNIDYQTITSFNLLIKCKLWGIKRPIGVDLDRWGIKTLLDSLLHVLNALDLLPCTKKIDREWNTRINIFYQTFLFLPITRTCTFDGFLIFNCHKYVKDLRLENSNYNSQMWIWKKLK